MPHRIVGIICLIAASSYAQQETADSPAAAALASAGRVEIRGVIEKVEFRPGAGIPCLLVRTGGEIVRVQLGSMRYLLEKDFNPRAGAAVVVKGFRVNQEIVGRTVELPDEKKVIELRSADGAPLWRMGRYGRKGR